MSEEQESSEDKQSKLKLKLKKMGVMHDGNAAPEQNSTPWWKRKLPILIMTLFAVGFIWWISKNELTSSDKLAEHTPTDVANVRLNQPLYLQQPGLPPIPPPWVRPHPYDRAYTQTMGPATNPAYTDPYFQRRPLPPPNWQPYHRYPPPAPGFYAQPYYGGPPPGYYSNPHYQGYNIPRPPPK